MTINQTQLSILYHTIFCHYENGEYKKMVLKKKGFEKFFSSGKQEEIENIQDEIEKYILYLWSKENNKTIDDFKYIYTINNMNSSFLKTVTFNELLSFISPQTEII